MARSLADRLRAHEQQKARLVDAEAKLKTQARKARTRELIQAGGLVDKAGLLTLDPNALYGALLSLASGAGDPQQVRAWAAIGGRVFARDTRLEDEEKEPLTLTFPAPLVKDATAALRAAGFRFNKLFQHWEGRARFDDAQALATAHAGTLRQVPPPASADTAAPEETPAGARHTAAK